VTATAGLDDPYAALALVYDDWQARYGSFSNQVLARLLPVLDQAQPPVTSFLEAGCGTGALLLELAARRPAWRLTGTDASPAMLARAAAKPGARGVRWHRTSLGIPVPDAPFDAAGCFFNTLNHLADVAQLSQALISLGRALRPGALLAFDVNNQAGYARWWNGRNLYEGPGWRMQSDARYDESRREAQATIAIRRGLQTAQVTLRERLFTDAEIAAALATAGLQVVSCQLWSPTPDGQPGSTFWLARKLSRQTVFRA
jgi:SAM-dependent methyltransferase